MSMSAHASSQPAHPQEPDAPSRDYVWPSTAPSLPGRQLCLASLLSQGDASSLEQACHPPKPARAAALSGKFAVTRSGILARGFLAGFLAADFARDGATR